MICRKRRRIATTVLDDLYARPDEPPTEAVPARTDEQDYFLEVEEGSRLHFSGDGHEPHIRVTGDLSLQGPRGRFHALIERHELDEVAERIATPRAHRPPWLGVMAAPRLRPRWLDVNLFREFALPIKPLVFESAATEWPWCTIGKVFSRKRGQPMEVGSGVLVGPRLLLTASHAMPWGSNDWDVRFVPNYRNGNDPRFGHAYVDEFRGVRNEDDVTGLDYVICKLNWRIGDRTGWMGSQWWSDEDQYYDREWISVGYPVSQPNGGERPSIEIPVQVRDIDGDGSGLEIETHKFALGGWSGGPLWNWINGDPKVVGIESGFEKDFLDPTRTVFAGGRHLVDLVKYGWANWN